MKIYIAGIQGTGKTSVIEVLKSNYKNLPMVLPSIGRTMKQMGIPINEFGDEETQIEALVITLEQTLQTEGIYSRSWLDGLVYTQFLYEQGKVSEKTLQLWKRWADKYQKMFDVYFYIRPEFGLVDDGVRSTDAIFFNRSKELMEQYVQEYSAKIGKPFHILTGSIQERYLQIKKVLDQYDIE